MLPALEWENCWTESTPLSYDVLVYPQYLRDPDDLGEHKPGDRFGYWSVGTPQEAYRLLRQLVNFPWEGEPMNGKARYYGIRGRCGYVHSACLAEFQAANAKYDAQGGALARRKWMPCLTTWATPPRAIACIWRVVENRLQ